MRVYHRTTEDAARAIREAGSFLSQEQGAVFVSNRACGYATGYGSALVELDIPDGLLILDDEFQDGEEHYRIDAADIRPEWIC